MTHANPPTREELKRYLYYELPDAERDALEERLFEDEGLFYEVRHLENDLVDAYARQELA